MENEILFDYIGKTRTPKLMKEITDEYYERKFKKFPKGYENRIDTLASITVVDGTEIKAIGESCIDDLLLNNLAIWIKATLLDSNTPIDEPQVELVDSSGVSRGMFWQGGSNAAWNNRSSVSLGSSLQVGQGIAAATRSDFSVQTPFANGGIEDSLFGTGVSSYNSGTNRVFVPSALSPTFGGGSISEIVYFMRWKYDADAQRSFAISRDNISPSVNFSAGNALLIDYTFQL